MDWFSRRSPGQVRSSRGERRPSVSEICPELLIGEYPREQDIEWLKESFGVTALHSLQDEEDLDHHGLDLAGLQRSCRRHAIRLVRTPIPDGSADHVAAHLGQALEDLGALIDAGERVYLHCNAGLNRAPTVAIAFLHARRHMSLAQALAHVKRRRPCGPFMTVLEDHFGAANHQPSK